MLRHAVARPAVLLSLAAGVWSALYLVRLADPCRITARSLKNAPGACSPVMPLQQKIWVEHGKSSSVTPPDLGLPELGMLRIYDRSQVARRNLELRLRAQRPAVMHLGTVGTYPMSRDRR